VDLGLFLRSKALHFMGKRYKLGDFLVDTSRNQISLQSQLTSLPPKALSVLTYLAENQGHVASHDELLAAVWPNTVVTPNTLQRCIAQLRKAFGESSRSQNVIKTHSKQGYSLECEVEWLDEGNAKQSESLSKSADLHRYQEEQKPLAILNWRPRYVWIAAICLTLSGVVFTQFILDRKPDYTFGEIRYITATDDKEYNASYSSDGQYILFHRYYDQACINNIWARSSESLVEHRLTAEKGSYGNHAHSPNGEKLAFVQSHKCTKAYPSPPCFKLMTINFQEALRRPQSPREVLDCQNHEFKNLYWIDDETIAMLKSSGDRWRLIRYSIADSTSSVVYELKSGNITAYTFSRDLQLYAVSSIQDNGIQTIDMISVDGKLLSSNEITLPSSSSQHLKIHPVFVPNLDKLIFSSFGDLYFLSPQGVVEEASFPFDTSVGSPSVHPNGQSLLLIKGRYDSDVASVPLINIDQKHLDPPKPPIELEVLERTIEGESIGKYQPGREAFAMSSSRTGSEQIWLFDNETSRPLTSFKKGTFVKSMFWNEDGSSLLALANRELYEIGLNNTNYRVSFDYPVLDLFFWNSKENKVIANVMIQGIKTFVEIDLKYNTFTTLDSRPIRWAVQSIDGTLVYQDESNRFWKNGVIEAQEIISLNKQASRKRFVINKQRVYGINSDNQLWTYDLQKDSLSIIGKLDREITFISDVTDDRVLLTYVVSAKKEVIELPIYH
jgi:transcriptional activator of cad operon